MNKFCRIPIRSFVFMTFTLVFLLSTGISGGLVFASDGDPAFSVSEAVKPGISPAVRDLPILKQDNVTAQEINPRQIPSLPANALTLDSGTNEMDPLVGVSGNNLLNTPAINLSFEGISATGYVPPDTIGDVGPNHYVQMVNTSFAIYDKTGNLLDGPHPINQLWQGQGNLCASQNGGDPVVLYDPLDDRWLLSQFTSSGNNVCMAVSQTGDPLGSYYLYQFSVPQFPDYFKLAVWPDGYYMSANESSYTAYAFNRANMLAGNPATYQRFSGGTNFLMPSDVDGNTPPPAGSPNYFYTFKDNSYHGGVDRLEVYSFHVDWTTPANSTFTLSASIPISSYNYTVCGWFVMSCIPQKGTAQKLDPVSEWPMWRLQYRNFGSYETLVGNFAVDATGTDKAGIRWFELQKQGGPWTLYQEGTHFPTDGHNRFIGSIAMDSAGDIALGYSVSSTTLNPSIRYAGRLATDPLGTLQTEASMMEGTGSQTGANRWGDYSSMNVDPSDDCTFWYTTEYYQVSSSTGWRTRIGNFKFDNCGAPPTDVMHVGQVSLRYRGTTGRWQLLSSARILDQTNAPVAGAAVDMTCTLPDSQQLPMQQNTNNRGEARFKFNSSLSGSYECCVSNVSKTGWTYDPDQNDMTCSSTVVP